ncbi:hypothetical protein LWI28_013320 [Acer negundo]|uniref:Uncharacterized protein n=1 Tax=Acer negundo TaxID=4023 RepID=A0AAD5NJ14_ACENE|nr:hypothetical protein LWI28_013320 [Acer negundo]
MKIWMTSYVMIKLKKIKQLSITIRMMKLSWYPTMIVILITIFDHRLLRFMDSAMKVYRSIARWFNNVLYILSVFVLGTRDPRMSAETCYGLQVASVVSCNY